MIDEKDPAPFSILVLLGLRPFGVKPAIVLYLALCAFWLGSFSVIKGSDLFAMRPLSQEEISASRWQKSTDPSQLGKNNPPPQSNQNMGINELFRPQPNGINPFDATRQSQSSAPALIADWPARSEAIAIMASIPALGLLCLLLFIRHILAKERAEAEIKAADKAREEEERHRARRRGKGIPMRRIR